MRAGFPEGATVWHHGPPAMVPRPFAVVARRRETTDVWTVTLRARTGPALSFAPGQCTMLSAGGAGEVPVSISGDPGTAEDLMHTVRAVGGATAAICATEVGRVLGVRGPFGQPWPLEAAEGGDVVIVAGGIGLAPLRPAILRLLARRERYGRLILLLGGRTPDTLLFPQDRAGWAERGLEVHVTVDMGGPEWLGHVGVVTRLVRRAGIDGACTTALLCGPEVMMRFTADALRTAGVAPVRMHASVERNMQCGIGHCGHCQLGPKLVCRDGPVFTWEEIEPWLRIREL